MAVQVGGVLVAVVAGDDIEDVNDPFGRYLAFFEKPYEFALAAKLLVGARGTKHVIRSGAFKLKLSIQEIWNDLLAIHSIVHVDHELMEIAATLVCPGVFPGPVNCWEQKTCQEAQHCH